MEDTTEQVGWEQAREHLAELAGQEWYEAHVASLELIFEDDEEVWLRGEDEFVVAALREEYLDLLTSALRDVTGFELQVTLVGPDEEGLEGPTHVEEGASPDQLDLFLPRTLDTALPNNLVRSSLFAVVGRGARENLEEETLATWGDTEMVFTGEQFDQDDLDLWLVITRLAHEQKDWTVKASGYEILQRLKYGDSGWRYEWLNESLKRIRRGEIELRQGQNHFYDSMINAFYYDGEARRYVIVLSPRLSTLFGLGYTRVDMETRSQLTRQLTRWLQMYIRSHRATQAHPHFVSVEKLHLLSGSSIKRLRDFRAKLRRSLDELIEIQELECWKIERDLVHVVRSRQEPPQKIA